MPIWKWHTEYTSSTDTEFSKKVFVFSDFSFFFFCLFAYTESENLHSDFGISCVQFFADYDWFQTKVMVKNASAYVKWSEELVSCYLK